MKKANRGDACRTVATVAVFLAAVLLLAATGCGRTEEDGRMKVAASIVPLADFCRNVGGGEVEVMTMVPPGASPHTYEPTTEQMKFMSEARVFVYNGLELEAWITDIVSKVDNDDLVEVCASDSIPRSDLVEVDRQDEHKSDGGNDENVSNNSENDIYDPHVWLDPNLAIFQVKGIRDAFIEADPKKRRTYEKNATDYIHRLEDLDRRVREETSTFTRKKFVSFHPAFTYYAHRYGLEQVGVIEELPGKEPSAGEIADLLDVIKEQGVQVIFTEPQFNPRAAEAIASESGADVVLESLDPLGDPHDPQTSTYVKLVEHDTGVMAEAMK